MWCGQSNIQIYKPASSTTWSWMRGKSTKSLIKKYGDVGQHDAGDTVICDGTWLLCEGGRREGQDCYTDAPAYLNYVEQQCKQQRRVNTEQNSLILEKSS